jgi:hypothetical protein
MCKIISGSPAIQHQPGSALGSLPTALGTDHKEGIFDPGWFYAGVHSQRFTNAPAGTLFYGDPGMPGASYANRKLVAFSPRVALVFDPRRKGNESIRAGYGIFYGGTPLFLQVATHSPWADSISCGTLNGGLSNPYYGCNGVLRSNPFPRPIRLRLMFNFRSSAADWELLT